MDYNVGYLYSFRVFFDASVKMQSVSHVALFQTSQRLTDDWSRNFLQIQGTAYESGSVTLVESKLSIPESPSILQELTASVRNTQRDSNQSRTGECFLLTAAQSELNATTPDCRSHEALSTFAPHRSGKRSQQNQKIHKPVIHERRYPAKTKIAMETEEVSALGVVREVNQECRKIQIPETDGYLQPADPDNMQGETINTGMRHGKAQTQPPKRPQPKPRVKSLRRRETGNLFQCKHSTLTGTLSDTPAESNPLHATEVAQHCASLNSANQSNHVIPKTRTRHIQEHGYQNETPYQNSLRRPDGIKSPYTPVLSDTNWEVSRDQLSLFERIGGGSFGQVWKGAAFDVAGDKEWSAVAVKMLKGN